VTINQLSLLDYPQVNGSGSNWDFSAGPVYLLGNNEMKHRHLHILQEELLQMLYMEIYHFHILMDCLLLLQIYP